MVCDSGLTGVGEAAIAYGHGGTAAAGMIKDLAENILLGRDPFRIEEVWSVRRSARTRSAASRKNYSSGRRCASCWICQVD
jgi:L-alanine-DL-glutamate epimerase-like enolase superfamily enzyme